MAKKKTKAVKAAKRNMKKAKKAKASTKKTRNVKPRKAEKLPVPSQTFGGAPQQSSEGQQSPPAVNPAAPAPSNDQPT